jgi:hypothetical protein
LQIRKKKEKLAVNTNLGWIYMWEDSQRK